MNRTGLLFLFFFAGCTSQTKSLPLYHDATGETAKLRVIGFTDYTSIDQILSCTDNKELGFLRDSAHEERNPPRIVNEGFTKAVPSPEKVPLDYQERLIPALGWLRVNSAFFASDGGLCTLDTNWFKPEKDALYEVRNRLSQAGNICSMQFFKIDQETGKAEPVKIHKRLAEFLPCQTLQ
ncbi:Uncharacterised protein [Serratia plymuthica]|nr:Uncharacterised protein [Serratia plymuthica]